MHETREKIFGLFLFVVLMAGIIYMALNKNNNYGEIKMIIINGNNLLSENEYLALTNMKDISAYKDLSLPVIKDRFDKHPYVKRANVAFNGNNRVSIDLTEKKIMAMIINNSEPYFVTDEFEILPLLKNTRLMDLPVISNPKQPDQILPLLKCRTNDLVEAFKIIEAVKLTNARLMKQLSEINLRRGGDIILTFSGIKPPVIFGRGQEAKKIVYLEIMWESLLNKDSFSDGSDYIDLRFANEVYVGKTEKPGFNQ